MFSRPDSSYTVWVGLSFLAIGLMAGLLLTGGTSLIPSVTSPDSAPETLNIDELPIVDVSLDDDPVLGEANAPVIIVEFSDFQCSFCERFHTETFPLIKEKYIDTGLVKFVVRDFINGKHPQSSLSAQAAECAGEVGGDEAYYKMFDKLFEKTSEWSGSDTALETFVSYGDELGLDISTCLANGDMLDETNSDYAASRGYGVSGTPTFFINGKKLVGAWPYEVFESIIESELTP